MQNCCIGNIKNQSETIARNLSQSWKHILGDKRIDKKNGAFFQPQVSVFTQGYLVVVL